MHLQSPSGMHYEPIRKKVNAGFRGRWVNSENISKNEAEIIALWHEDHHDKQILVED